MFSQYSKEKFHNQLALHLGYERIVKDKRLNIQIDYSCEDAPIVKIEVIDTPMTIEFKASEVITESIHNDPINALGMKDEIQTIIDAVHTAYIESTKELATF